MKLIRSIYDLQTINFLSGNAITIGNFDGMHLGHQNLITELKKQAKQLQLSTLVITFEPQPKEFFSSGNDAPRLMRLREKFEILKSMQIDTLLCLRFNKKLANLSPREFVKNILLDALNVKLLMLGKDFRFGAGRSGDIDTLKILAQEFGFSLSVFADYELNHVRVSSTRIREALQQGDMQLAEKLLGHPFSLSGKVIFGHQRGRNLGFPTANINLHRQSVPLLGVFVIQTIVNEKPYYGVANIGMRPTFAGTRVLMEVHLFDFQDNLYGKNLTVVFLKKLRDEKHFNAFQELIEQIKNDVEAAKIWLNNYCRRKC